MPANRPNSAEQLERERRAWSMRCQGKSGTTIAEALGISNSGAYKILARVEEREARRLTKAVHRIKARQTAQLDFVIEESLSAWLKSKTPRKRAGSKGVKGGADGEGSAETVETLEVIERDGDTGYLYCAMTAQSNQRSIWGLDVQAAPQESTTTVSELVADLLKRGADYEARKAAEGQAGDPVGPPGPDPGGAPEVPG